MKILITNLTSGIGNQLFEYATARAIAMQNGARLLFDISAYQTDAYGRKPALHHFNTKLSTFSTGFFKKMITPGNRIHGLSKRLDLVEYKIERGFNLDPTVFKLEKLITHIKGYWQSEYYFSNIREVLLEELTLAEKIPHIKELVKTNLPLLAVHVRRKHGFWLGSDYRVDQRYGSLSLEYYTTGIEEIKKKVGPVLVVVFSDDVAWCRENFRFPDTDVLFWEDVGTYKDYQELVLMSQCDHHVIANSTFSWWGAWLNTNPNQIVLRPEQPFIDRSLCYEEHYPSRWIAINNSLSN